MYYVILVYSGVQGRGNRGGAVGATCPHNFEAVGPPTLECESRSLFFFALELGSLPKNSGPNLGSF